jgi:hypothetical protein
LTWNSVPRGALDSSKRWSWMLVPSVSLEVEPVLAQTTTKASGAYQTTSDTT